MNRTEFIRVGLLVPFAPLLLPAITEAAAVGITATEFVEGAGVAGKLIPVRSWLPRHKRRDQVFRRADSRRQVQV